VTDVVSRATEYLEKYLKDGHDAADYQVMAAAMCAPGNLAGERLEDLLHRITTDSAANIVLLESAITALVTNMEMPAALRKYVATVLRGVAKEITSSGGGRKSPWLRNACIVGAVEILRRGGIRPTRNVGADGRCGCDIVAEILGKNGYNISGRGVAEGTLSPR
jgi:hypothetical protein